MDSPMSPQDPAFVGFRLQELEKRFEKMETGLNGRLDTIQGTIGSLAFVRKDVYESERDAMREKVDAARALSMWALGTTLTVIATLGVLVGVLKLVAG